MTFYLALFYNPTKYHQNIGTILAIFDMQVTLILPTKFQANWPFGSGEEVQNRFSSRPLWRQLGYPIRVIYFFSYF